MAMIDNCPRCGFNRMGGECPDHPRMVPPAASLADRRRQEFMRLANECEARLLMEVANRIGVLGSSISDALPRPPVARPRRTWWQCVLAVFYGDPPDTDPDALFRYADAVANLRSMVNTQREGLEGQVRYYFGALRDGHPDNPRFDRMYQAGHLLTADGWLVNERAIDAVKAGRVE